MGDIYYLGADNCVYNSVYKKLVCNMKDFEVNLEGRIIGINDGLGGSFSHSMEEGYLYDMASETYYKSFKYYKGLTMIRNKPIFID